MDACPYAGRFGSLKNPLYRRHDRRLVGVKLRGVSHRQAEIAWSDIDSCQPRRGHNPIQLVKRLLGFDHGQRHDLLIGSLGIIWTVCHDGPGRA